MKVAIAKAIESKNCFQENVRLFKASRSIYIVYFLCFVKHFILMICLYALKRQRKALIIYPWNNIKALPEKHLLINIDTVHLK